MIETNMTKEDWNKFKDDPIMKLARLFLTKDEYDNVLKRVEKELNDKSEKKEIKNEYVSPKIKVEPVKLNHVFHKVKINKDGFEHFVDGFCKANDTVEALEDNGFMFTESSPIVMYENLISGLLESIFGKDVSNDIIAYAYGDSSLKMEDLWEKVIKSS